MDLKSEFGIDEGLAEGGVWLPIGENGARLLLAAWNNPRHEREMEPINRRFRAIGRDVPEAEHERAIAKTVLLSWEGIEENGQPIEPTEENRLLMLRKYGRFKSLVIREATNVKNFQADEKKT
jgi:hypothetical protein